MRGVGSQMGGSGLWAGSQPDGAWGGAWVGHGHVGGAQGCRHRLGPTVPHLLLQPSLFTRSPVYFRVT